MSLLGALNKFMLGTTQFIGSSMLPKDDPNFSAGSGSYLYLSKSEYEALAGGADGEGMNSKLKYVDPAKLDGTIYADWQIPNILYSPEAIFGNKVAALDVNFINSHKYTAVEGDGASGEATKDSAEHAVSIAEKIGPTIASWYEAFRNIAIVGLLSVLVYIGIRIIIASTAPDKAKYKERLKDWLVALCLVFVMHIIMAGILMITEKITDLFADTGSEVVVAFKKTAEDGVTFTGDVQMELGDSYGFKTNLIGYVRLLAQSDEWGDSAAYTILFLALVVYTIMFTFTYFKRVLYMAFFTMIAPLVALTYPLDKLGDTKAQAFNIWLKEYTMNAIIQPVHLILYTALISTAIDLATENLLYAIVAIGFLMPAEKFIKKLFGFDRAETVSGLGAFAGGALAMKGLQSVAKLIGGGSGKGNNNAKGNTGGGEEESSLPSRGQSVRYHRNPLGIIAAEGREPQQQQTQGGGDNGQQQTQGGANNGQQQTQGGTNNGQQQTQGGANNGQQQPLQGEENNGQQPQQHQNGGDNGQQQQTSSTGEQQGNYTDNNQQQSPERSRWNRIKRGSQAVLGYEKRKIKNTFSKENLGKGAKKGGKFLLKAAGAAAGATLAGTVAAGAALTTGDLSNAMTMAAGGVALGAGIGGSLAGKGANAAGRQLTQAKQVYKGAAYTKDELKNKKQEKFDENFKKNEDNYKYLTSTAGMTSKEAEAFMKNNTQDFLDAGVTDIGLMVNAKKMAEKKGYDKESMVARAKIASKLSKDFEENYDAQNNLRTDLNARGFDNNRANNLIDEMKELKK